jgi:hypothetical protein
MISTKYLIALTLTFFLLLLMYLYLTEVIIFVDTGNKIFIRDFSFNSENLGQLGDYFGGLLNPLIGFITIILLLQTIERMDTTNKVMQKQLSTAIISEKVRESKSRIASHLKKIELSDFTINVRTFCSKTPFIEQENSNSYITIKIDIIFYFFQYGLENGQIKRSDCDSFLYKHINYSSGDNKIYLQELIREIIDGNAVISELTEEIKSIFKALKQENRNLGYPETIEYVRDILEPLKFNRLNIGSVGEKSFFIAVLNSDLFFVEFFDQFKILADLFEKNEDATFKIHSGLLKSNMLNFKQSSYVKT